MREQFEHCFMFAWLILCIVRAALDALKLTRYCCRRMLLTHADLIEKLLAYNSEWINLLRIWVTDYGLCNLLRVPERVDRKQSFILIVIFHPFLLLVYEKRIEEH